MHNACLEARSRVGYSNLDKVLWPEAKVTKGDLISYLEGVAHLLVPLLRNRPLTVMRSPDGIQAFSFFQKATPRHAPEWVRTVGIWAPSARREVPYTLCNSTRTLLWLGNQASIEFHPWLSRTDRLARPDHLVLDIDPPEGRFDLAVKVALVVRQHLDHFGLASATKTSGAKGVHVYVPIRRQHGFRTVRAVAEHLAQLIEQSEPGLVTTSIRKEARAGRVFVDAGRNGEGAHVVAAYSPRARREATVSFPVAWGDIDAVHPHDFSIRSAMAGMDSTLSWSELLPSPQPLPGALTDALAAADEKTTPQMSPIDGGNQRSR